MVSYSSVRDETMLPMADTLTTPTEGLTSADPEKDACKSPPTANMDDWQESSKSELALGVELAKAGKQVLTTKQRLIACAIIWLVNFIQSLSSGIITTLTPYVTSSFEKHALTGTTTIIAGIAAGLFQLPFAKILDIWGRPHGLALAVTFETMGLVMMAACKNVETYCAAQVFYNVGYQGITLTIIIFIADNVSLGSRGMIIALVNTPSIATVWAAGPAARHILATIGFRWGFGVWCIVVPVVCAPWLLSLIFVQNKARKQGLVTKKSEPRSPTKSLLYFLRESDIVGLLILITGLALFLLAFNLYSNQQHQWKSPMIICFVVFGTILIILFPIYERYITRKTFISWPTLSNRTVILVFATDLLYYMSEQTWASYFYSTLVVVFNQSITNATYINNAYFVSSALWAVLLGLALGKYGHLKHYSLVFGIPFSLLGTGLLIKFRTWSSGVGYVVMCQIFLGVGGGTMYVIEQLVIMAATAPENIPSTLAVLNIVVATGKAIGGTIGTAIWTTVFKEKLAKYLPLSALPYLPQIYGNLYRQISSPPGSPIRIAVDHAYSDTNRLIMIAAVCFIPPCIIFISFWHDYDIRKTQGELGKKRFFFFDAA